MVFILLNILLYIIIYINDKNIIGIASPTLCLSFPIFIIAIIYDYLGPLLGFYYMSDEIYSELLFSSIVFYFGGLIFRLPIRGKKSFHKIIFKKKENTTPRSLIILASVIIILLIVRILSLGGQNVLFDEDLQTVYASNGVFGHLLVITIFLFSLFLSKKYTNTKTRMILLFGCFFCILFYQVKGWLILPLLVSLFFKINNGEKIRYSRLFIIGILIIAMFTLGYAFVVPLDNEDNRLFLYNHFAKYLFAGVSGWSEAIKHDLPIGQDPLYILSPFSTVFGYVHPRINSNYSFIYVNNNGEYTNVYTFYGTYLLYSGRLLAYCYFFCIGFFSYGLRYVTMRNFRKANYTGINLGYSTLCSALALGFFASYFSLLNVYEIIVFSFLFSYVYKEKFYIIKR